jgi:hypothetical protein
MKLKCEESTKFTLHPAGIAPAVCVDVIDRGEQPGFEGNGVRHVLMVVFESEEKDDEGNRLTISRTFTASLNPKASLNKFLAQWRGKAIATGEEIDLDRLLGKSVNLVITHVQGQDGQTRAKIEAAAPCKQKVTPSGHYDGDALRHRLAEKDKERGMNQPATPAPAKPMPSPAPAPSPAPVAEVEEDDVPF